MPKIARVVLRDFKRFEKLDLALSGDLNILLGDNETGKSSVLLAIDLVLSASRYKVDALGIESLLPVGKVRAFRESPKRSFNDLPQVLVEVHLTTGTDPSYNGVNNTRGVELDGLRMECRVPHENSEAVAELLKEPDAPFPFEYYETKFCTFAGTSYTSYRKPIRHLVLDSSRVDSEQASRDYTLSLFMAHVPVSQRSRLESDYRRSKEAFSRDYLGKINKGIESHAFAVRTSTKSNLQTDLAIHEDNLPLDLRGRGRQNFLKTSFALRRSSGDSLDVLLLEEPENHLSHTSTRKLVESLAAAQERQVIVATHSA